MGVVVTDPTDEIKAMRSLVVILDKLEPDTRKRVILWVFGVYDKKEQAAKEGES